MDDVSSKRRNRHSSNRLRRSQSPVDRHGSSDRQVRPRHHHSRSHLSKTSLPSFELPFGASPLRRGDEARYRQLFSRYLDLQKSLDLDSLGESEAKGRWKSFMKRWNRGDLAEGWYDKQTLDNSNYESQQRSQQPKYEPPTQKPGRDGSEPSESDDDLGPSLPATYGRVSGSAQGPGVPSFEHIEFRRAQEQDHREEESSQLRKERLASRKLEKERLDELAPKAQPGSKERQMEKRKELAASNKAFAAAGEGADAVDVPDADLMGDGDDLQTLKKRKLEMQKRKSDKELRREEIMQARHAEREERMQQIRQREDKTMESLIQLARDRFG